MQYSYYYFYSGVLLPRALSVLPVLSRIEGILILSSHVIKELKLQNGNARPTTASDTINY